MERSELKYALEGLLFATEKPLSPHQIKDAFEETIEESLLRELLEELRLEYETQNRGFRLCEIAGGYQLATDGRFESMLKKFYQTRLKKRLSQATLETLSIIAYKQPVTKAEIEFVRGVNCDAAMKVLLEKDMVKIVGKKEVPGRPMLYGTTEEFLHHFGLNSTQDLPPLSQYSEQDIDPNMLPPQMRVQEAPVSVEVQPVEEAQSETAPQEQATTSSEENHE